jgi:hypothetical protein
VVDGAVSAGKVPGMMSFLTSDNAGAYTERMTINSAGNVGIGTRWPTSKLTVDGDIESKGFKVGGLKAFSVSWMENTFIGYYAGQANTTGGGNSASGYGALSHNTAGSANTASGGTALYYNATGNNNTATGVGALYSNTTGNYNTASGSQALYFNTTGNYNTASGDLALYFNTTGYENTASGYGALDWNTAGYLNTASGSGALARNTTGYQNTASGESALSRNDTGAWNTASGSQALRTNTTGYNNTASGWTALAFNTTGNNNTASGSQALYYNTTGNLSTAVGYSAGYNAVGSNNIFINNEGADADSNTIRLGIVTPTENYPDAHTQTFIAGIANATVSGSAVFIDSNGQLGIATSSGRFKEDIQDMGNASSSLLQLRPVTFHYKPEYSRSAPGLQYGLIAEEVAKVYPDMVQYDKDGRPFTVQYQVLSSMLLNELQKQHAAMERKDVEIANLRRAMREAESASNARLSAIERTLERLTMQTSENREGK